MSPIDLTPDTPVSSNSDSNGRGALVALGNRLAGVPAVPWHFAPPSRPEILTAKPNPLELLHALRRRWALAIGLGVAMGGILAAMVWVLVPVRYEAAAYLRMYKKREGIMVGVGSGDDDFQNFKRTQQVLAKGRFVLNAVLRDSKIAQLPTVKSQKDPISWLENQVMVDNPSDSELLKISMRGESPSELVQIVNATTDAYLSEIVNTEKNERLRQRGELEDEYQRKMEDFRKKSTHLHELEKNLGISGSETARFRAKLANDELNALQMQRNKAQEKLRELELKIELVKKQSEQMKNLKIPPRAIENEVNKDPLIQQLQQRLQQIQLALSEEQRRAVPGAPSVERLRAQFTETEEAIEERRVELRQAIMEQLATGNGTSGEFSLPLLETERAQWQASFDGLNTQIDEKVKQLQQVENYNSESESLRVELSNLHRLTTEMGHQLEMRDLDLKGSPRVVLLEKAFVPRSNDAIRKYMGVAFAGMFGFGLILVGVAYVEFQSRRLNSAREVHEGLGIRVMGNLPPLSGRLWRRAQSGKGQEVLQGLLVESIDSIRAALIHTTSIDSPRVVMVSSAEPREGKTTVASQLAASLARSGRRTVLIDGDLRGPAIHQVFELPQEPGLCELLRGEVEQEAVIHPTAAPNLWLVPAGRCDMQSVQALACDTLGTLVSALRLQFDFVVIDSGPVMKVADPLLIGQHVDAAILSVQRDISKIPQIYEASDRLRSVGVVVLGAVVNGINVQPHHHSVGA